MVTENRILKYIHTLLEVNHNNDNIYLNNNKSWGLISQTNWSRYSSTEVYLTSGYSWEASTPNDGSISKLV